jgi:hypothetical protein
MSLLRAVVAVVIAACVADCGAQRAQIANCTVNVTMMDGKVKRMNYVGPTGGLLSQNEQCFFAVANCTY